MPPTDTHHEIERLLKKNTEVLEDNNKLLRKLHRFHIISAWFKIVWLALIIGLPFALYFYILEPYFSALGSNFETFQVGIGELPGIKGIGGFFGGDPSAE